MYSILLLSLTIQMVLVQCVISDLASAEAIQSQYDTNNLNYMLNPVQSFTADDRRTLYTPYGFYGMPVNQYLDSNSYGEFQHQHQHQQPYYQLEQQEQQQQQAKVKKDIREANSGNALILDDIRNDLMGIKDNIAVLATQQKNMENNVNQRLSLIKRPFLMQPNLFSRLNQLSRGSVYSQGLQQQEYQQQMDASDTDDDDTDVESDHIVSSFQHEHNYGNGAIYPAPAVAPPPLPTQPYGSTSGYDYSYMKKPDTPKKPVKKTLLEVMEKKRQLKDAAAARRATSRANALQRNAQRTLAFIRNGVVNAIWTALVVACVKLTPLLLYGVKLLFQSLVPLAGLAVRHNRRGLFGNADDSAVDAVETEDDVNDDEHPKKAYRHYSD